MEIKISIVSVLRKRKFERGLIEWSSWQQWQTPIELNKGKEKLEKLKEEIDNPQLQLQASMFFLSNQ